MSGTRHESEDISGAGEAGGKAQSNGSAEIQISRRGGVGRIVVSNPARRNALTMAMKRQLLDAFQEFEKDPGTRCIVLAGAGTQSFVSGADISEFQKYRSDAASELEYMRISTAAMLAPAEASKPVIASIAGACVGGGLQLAVTCDLRIAARSAFFMMPAARLGVGYPYPGLSLFISLLGRGRAADLFMSARRIGAEEALQLGLINRVVDDDQLEEAVATYAESVAAHAPLTLRLVKESIRHFTGASSIDNPVAIQKLLEACESSQDIIEGRTAFLEKRKPTFQGR